MTDDRELRVEKTSKSTFGTSRWVASELVPPKGQEANGVWLEFDDEGNVGGLAKWMVDWLADGVYPNGIPKDHRESIDEYDRRIECLISNALSRILKEAQGGE